MTSGILSRGQLGRRRMLAAAGAALLVGAVDGCSLGGLVVKRRTPAAGALQLAPLRAATDRITQITVCTRPFRAQGPRLDVERTRRCFWRLPTASAQSDRGCRLSCFQ